jgi:hypothetical protein
MGILLNYGFVPGNLRLTEPRKPYYYRILSLDTGENEHYNEGKCELEEL